MTKEASGLSSRNWRVVHDGPSYGMLQSPDGRIFGLQELSGGGPRSNGGPWATPSDNDQLCERFASALSERLAIPREIIATAESCILNDNLARKGEGGSPGHGTVLLLSQAICKAVGSPIKTEPLEPSNERPD